MFLNLGCGFEIKYINIILGLSINAFIGEDTIRKPMALVLITCMLSVIVLTGCTTEDHRVMVTVKNLRDNAQNI